MLSNVQNEGLVGLGSSNKQIEPHAKIEQLPSNCPATAMITFKSCRRALHEADVFLCSPGTELGCVPQALKQRLFEQRKHIVTFKAGCQRADVISKLLA